MSFRRDGRGQAVTLGAILLFALLILAISLYQVNLVPQQNKAIEFNSYERASTDMVELENELHQTVRSGSRGSASVDTAVQYPVRVFTFNPGAASSTVRLVDTDSVQVTNAQATDPSVADRWDGSTQSFATKFLVFEPHYNVFQAQSVTTTGYLTHRGEGGNAVVLSQQSVVRGNTISLVTIDGHVESSSQLVALSSVPVSTSRESITVTGQGGNDIELSIPTTLDQAAWDDLLRTETSAGNVLDVVVDADDGRVTITLDGTQTYSLRVGHVELRERADDNYVAPAGATYIVDRSGDGAAVLDTQPVQLRAEVRDEYNNPVPGEEVIFHVDTAASTGDGTLDTSVTRADENGEVVTTFTPSASGTVVVEAYIGGSNVCTADPDGGPKCTKFTVDVSPGPDSADRAPTITGIRNVYKYKTTGSSGGDNIELTVDVADLDGDLLRVEAVAYDTGTDSTATLNNVLSDTSVSGTADSKTLTLFIPRSNANGVAEYHVLVTVTDDAGNIDSDSIVVAGNF